MIGVSIISKEEKKEEETKKHQHKQKIRDKFLRVDWFILLPYLILSITGVIMVYSASSYRLLQEGLPMWSSASKQLIFFILSLILIGVIYTMKIKVFRDSRLVNYFFYFVLVLLVYVLLFGQRINGAKGWISLPGFQFQPLELFKLALVIMMARYLTYRQFWTFARKWHFWFFTFFGLLLIRLQPDNGGVVICALLILALLVCNGESPKISGAATLLFYVVAVLGIFFLPYILPMQEYQKARFLVAQHPFDYARGEGHQLINSYYALSNGGWFGTGLGNSIEKKGFLPEAQTDFIFSITVEELGMFFGLFIIGLLLLLVLRILYIGIKAQSRFNSYLCIGISMMIFIQMFINLGGLVGIIPLTGVTLPFISQGGSSLIVLSIGVGLALNVSATERDYRLSTKKRRRLKIFE